MIIPGHGERDEVDYRIDLPPEYLLTNDRLEKARTYKTVAEADGGVHSCWTWTYFEAWWIRNVADLCFDESNTSSISVTLRAILNSYHETAYIFFYHQHIRINKSTWLRKAQNQLGY